MASGVPAASHTREFRALGSAVTIVLEQPGAHAAAAVDDVIAFFDDLQTACTRFVPTSPLMRANADPDNWHELPPVAIDILRCAHEAHLATGGLFDPRVHDDLVAYGYSADRSGAAAAARSAVVDIDVAALAVRAPHTHPWEFTSRGSAVHLGGSRVDLGGIGKGFAVRNAVRMLEDHAAGVFVNAGGDIGVAGIGPFDGYWHIGIEDAFVADQTRAVLRLASGGVATSSIRVHRWHTSVGPMHHLIDPRTGAPVRSAVRSVTVLDIDPMWAEVWSKSIFIAGSMQGPTMAATGDRAVWWIDEDNGLHLNDAAHAHHLWVRDAA